MPLIKNGRVVEDRYVRVARRCADARRRAGHRAGGALPRRRRRRSLRRDAPIGVVWPNNRTVAELAPHLDRLALVALVFPNFKDGRAYSQARLLRERYGYRGELRATGQILRDQFLFLVRAGFDALEVAKQSDVDAFAAALARYTVFYQAAGDGRIPAAPAACAHRDPGPRNGALSPGAGCAN